MPRREFSKFERCRFARLGVKRIEPRVLKDQRFEFRRALGQTEVASRRLYQYPRRAEFRLNSSEIHNDAEEGNLLRLEIAEPGLGIEYHAQVVKPTDPLYAEHLAIASNPVPNSDKRWGFR